MNAMFANKSLHEIFAMVAEMDFLTRVETMTFEIFERQDLIARDTVVDAVFSAEISAFTSDTSAPLLDIGGFVVDVTVGADWIGDTVFGGEAEILGQAAPFAPSEFETFLQAAGFTDVAEQSSVGPAEMDETAPTPLSDVEIAVIAEQLLSSAPDADFFDPSSIQWWIDPQTGFAMQVQVDNTDI